MISSAEPVTISKLNVAPKQPETATEVSAEAQSMTVNETAVPTKVDQITARTISISSALSELVNSLPSIVTEAHYNEIWGVQLKDSNDVPTLIVLEKFLRANGKDVAKAKMQLKSVLAWRKKTQPLKLLEKEYNAEKFRGLGYITVYPATEMRGREIVTWNIYGSVQDMKKTFGDLEEFLEWRTALMELSVKELDLTSATEVIPDGGEDQYRMVQVHDYLNVAFFRADPAIKKASKETINVMSMAYPELLKEKFFVNVPGIMGWMFTAMKVFLSPATVKKFHPLTYGTSLAGQIPGWGELLPAAYGGKGGDVVDGITVKYAAHIVEPTPKGAENSPAPATTMQTNDSQAPSTFAATKDEDDVNNDKEGTTAMS